MVTVYTANRSTTTRRFSVVVLVVSLIFSVATTSWGAQPESITSRMVRMVNELRVARGLNALAINRSLQESSERWSVHMALRGAIFHNENLGEEIKGNWVRVGENVGRGPSVEDIQVAFSTSPSHLDNLLDPRWDAMAIGIAKSSDGFLYVTQRFEEQPQVDPPPRAAPAAVRVRRVRPVRR